MDPKTGELSVRTKADPGQGPLEGKIIDYETWVLASPEKLQMPANPHIAGGETVLLVPAIELKARKLDPVQVVSFTIQIERCQS